MNDVVWFTTNKDGIVTALYLIPAEGGAPDTVISSVVDKVVGEDGKTSNGAVMKAEDGNVTVTADKSYTDTTDPEHEDTAPKKISADLAQFLGGLYKTGKATEIVYQGKTYTWITKEDDSSLTTLKGSNWRVKNADDTYTTLVKDITDDWKGTDAKWGGKDDAPYTATLVVNGVTMTYTVTVK